MKFEKKYIAAKFPYIVGMVILVGLAIVVKLVLTMTVNKDEPLEYKQKYVDGKLTEAKPKRGNILSDDGQLLSSSLPQYNVRYDFLSGIPALNTDQPDRNRFLKDSLNRDSLIRRKDSIFISKADSIAEGVRKICPEMGTEEEIKQHMLKGLEAHSQYYDMFKGHKFDYLEYQQLRRLPIFNLKGKYASGVMEIPRNHRHHPFDSLANRAIGEMFEDAEMDSAKSGIELAFDSILKGHPGLQHRKHIRSYDVDLPVENAEDGLDIISTINVTMQDICETALREKLIEVNADFGICILMDVKTGDIKAMVNLKQGRDGVFRETQNNALSALMEPGSTFKTASIMVALDDGRLSMNETVDTSKGFKDYGDRRMMDDGGRGHGICDVTAGVRYSSNVAVSTFIDRHYHNDPETFISGLKRIGIGAPLDMPFRGMANPRIWGPKENKYWSKVVSLPWLSIGYNSQIPPINTVAFYNAIANGGRMVKPRLVSGLSQNGEVVEEFPVEVIREQICKKSTLKNIQAILKDVVNGYRGTGYRVKSKYFYVSGKTGTAQVADEKGGYHSGQTRRFVSFCGYYPSDNPQYTCLVAIKTPHYPVSGGGTAGPVFLKIAEQIYAKHITTNISLAVDTVNNHLPMVKPGNVNAAQNVLKILGIQFARNGQNTLWGHTNTNERNVDILEDPTDLKTVPDLKGMGARDAVYALQARGMKVRISGCGQVKEQDVKPGTKVVKGQTVGIKLG